MTEDLVRHPVGNMYVKSQKTCYVLDCRSGENLLEASSGDNKKHGCSMSNRA